nr:hypothetical protein [uncultured Allomuricauda sp.]
MKVYYFQIIENLIGIALGVLFLYAHFTDNIQLLISCGIGTFIFIISQLSGQGRNQLGFITMIFFGAIIGYFVSKWYYGALWVCALYALGQIFGLFKIVSSKDALVQMLSENDLNRINVKESIGFIAMLIVPVFVYFILNN